METRSAPRDANENRTPLPTKVLLVAALAVAAWAVATITASRTHPTQTGDVALSLSILTALFALRVAGQWLARTRTPAWLPPDQYWALTPYVILLPVQLGIVGLLTWIDVDFARGHGAWTHPRPTLGLSAIQFSVIYGGAMVIRYAWRMSRRPEERWFGGAIPIVFHWVLAGYLFVLGSYHASY